MAPPLQKRNPASRAGLRESDLAGQADHPEVTAVAKNAQGGVRLVLSHLHHDRYQVLVEGEILVANSGDPEHAAARALFARGIIGEAQTIDASTGEPRLRFDIEVFARTTSEESSRGGLRIRKWRPDRLQEASPSGGVSTESAFCETAGIGEPAHLVPHSTNEIPARSESNS